MSGPADSSSRAKRGVLREVALPVLLGLLALVVLRGLLFNFYTIPSSSMEPTLHKGDFVVATKYDYGYSRYSIPFGPPLFSGRLFGHPPARGDIVIFMLPRDPRIAYIKRIIGLPGDRVQLRAGVVFINNRPMSRQVISHGMSDMDGTPIATDRYRESTPEGRAYLINSIPQSQAAENSGVYVVPPHCYFALGDNRDNSIDSRFGPGDQFAAQSGCGWDASLDAYMPAEEGVGFVPEQNLVAKATVVLLSTGAGQADQGFRRIE